VRHELFEKLKALGPIDSAVRVERVLLEGDPAAGILEKAREMPCDLIVMGTHGRTGVGRLLMGSVAEAVLRRAPCPVLTVKDPFGPMPPAEVAEREAVNC
jgi:nucleotide-binding universal stress UspA family protein